VILRVKVPVGLKIEKAVDCWEFWDTVKRKDSFIKQHRVIYVFECTQCSINFTCRREYLDKHKGFCKKCINLINLQKAKEPHKLKCRLRPYEALYNKFKYDRDRQIRKTEVSITYEQFLIFCKIDECHYCNNKIQRAEYCLSDNGGSYCLDRKNNNLGYSFENCVSCCWNCNEIKGNRFTYEEFMLLAPILKQIRLNRSFNV
jgi:hypothetical protein